MKKLSTRLCCLVLAVVLGLALMAGCSPKEGGEQTTTQPSQQGTTTQGTTAPTTTPEPKRDSLTFVTWIKATTYDVTAGGVADKGINHAIFDTLVKFGKTGDIEPMLAESWKESDDGMEVTFKLREDVTFHDGSPFSADDVIYFIETGLASTSFSSRISPYIAAYEKVDDYTVKLRKPFVYTNLYAFLAEQSYILPKATHEKDPVAYNELPIGTGPYKFVSKGADGAVNLEAYGDYYGSVAEVKYIKVQQPLDPSAAVIALETGDADFIVNVPNSQHPIITGNNKLNLVTTNSWGSMMLLLMGSTMKNDINLRKAIFHGVNRDNAVIMATEGTGFAATQLFSDRLMKDYIGEVPMEGYDEAKAKEYLAQSNYTAGDKIYITITDNAALAQSIQSDLKRIGLDIEIDQVDTAALLQKLGTGEIDMYMTDMGNSTMSPSSLLVTFRESAKQIGENVYSDEAYNALANELMAMTDASQLHAKTVEGLKMLRDFFNIVNIYESSNNYAHSKDFVYDYPVSATSYVYYYGEITLAP